MDDEAAYDGRSGTAGGSAFGAGLRALAAEKGIDPAALAAAAELDGAELAGLLDGSARTGVVVLARLARALRTRPIAFLQKTAILGLDAYAAGLDPLYFLPEGTIRYDARIYMREINPRHAVPEGDMTGRNPTLRALGEDALLDPLGKLELELAYLLRTAIQASGGRL